jgi:hypothetical protein
MESISFRILHVPEVGTAELDINAKVKMIWMNYSEVLFIHHRNLWNIL